MKVIVCCMFLLYAVSAAPGQPPPVPVVTAREAIPRSKGTSNLQNLDHPEDHLALRDESDNITKETNRKTGSRSAKSSSGKNVSKSTNTIYMSDVLSQAAQRSQLKTNHSNDTGLAQHGVNVAKSGECANATWRRKNQERRPSKKRQARIVGGTDAEHGEFPHEVSIQFVEFINYEHICGGAILSNRFVITSANCVNGRSLSALLVVAGEYSLSVLSGFEQERDVVNIIVHPEYEYHSSPVNDIALLELSSPLAFGFNVASISLALQVAPPSTSCIVTGWGSTTQGGQYADTLQKLSVNVVSDEDCSDLYGEGEILIDTMVCAAAATAADFCQGDEGGPLQCNDYLHGLASWGTGCGSGCPGVYTQVYHYSDWIKGVIGFTEG